MRYIIFDLDLTLVDTSNLEDARKSRNWNLVYSLIPTTTLYPGMDRVFSYIRDNGIIVTIVSTAPRSYIERIVRYHNIPANYIVGYHDAKPIKPHPAPMFKALELMGARACDTISFGDRAIDIQSSKAAGIKSIACFWDTKELGQLLQAHADGQINSPLEIITIF